MFPSPLKKPLSSTTVGEFLVLKVRYDNNPVLKGRVTALKRGAGDRDRLLGGIGATLSSTNTLVR